MDEHADRPAGEGENYSRAISHAPATRPQREKDLCLIRICGRCVKAMVRRGLLKIIKSLVSTSEARCTISTAIPGELGTRKGNGPR